MNITYTDKYNNYHNKDEMIAIKIAVDNFYERIGQHPDAKWLNSIEITIDINDDLIPQSGQEDKCIPALSTLSKRLIEFYITCCKKRGISKEHYLALFAHEVGHLFPQVFPCRKAFQNDVPNPYLTSLTKPGVKLVLIEKFESNKKPFREFVADYYACNWGFYDDIVALRKATNENEDYIKILKSYQKEVEYRVAAFLYMRS